MAGNIKKFESEGIPGGEGHLLSRAALEPPAHLSSRARALWLSIVPRRAKSPERLAVLTVALEALDRADEAAQVIAAEGMTTKTEKTGAVHVHPLVRVERENRGLFLRGFAQLNLTWDPHIDGTTGN